MRNCIYCGEELSDFFNLDKPYCPFGCDGQKLQGILASCCGQGDKDKQREKGSGENEQIN